MRRELSPLFSDDEDWVLPIGSMYAIGRTDVDPYYGYCVCEWANGAKGAIVDLFEVNDDVDSEGNSQFERPFGHRDCLYFIESGIDLVRVVEDPIKRVDLWTQCPLIAEGIIARFAKSTPTSRNYTEMYEKYYEMEKCFYGIERQRIDPYAFKANLDEDFANGVHLRQEQEKIELSLQRLLPFLREEHHASMKRVAEAYIDFIKSKMTTAAPFQKETSQKNNRKEKRDKSRYSFLLNVDSNKLESLYVMLSKRDDEGKHFIDGDLMKYNEADEEILSYVEDFEDENMRNTAVNKYLFNQVFSGQETDVRIVWTRGKNELWYFINTLYNSHVEVVREGKKECVRLLKKSETGLGIWQIVCSRFLNGKPKKVLDERTGNMVVPTQPTEFEEKDFHKYSEKNSPRNTSLLDAIINKVAPQRVETDEEAIGEETTRKKNGVKNPKSAKQLGEGFHDTSHKGKYE